MMSRMNSLDLRMAMESGRSLHGMSRVFKRITRYLLRWVFAQQGGRHSQLVKDRRYRALARGIPPRVWRRRSALLLMLRQRQGWHAE